MSIWKIEIYGNEADQSAACCTLLARGSTEVEAMQLALDDAKARQVHSSTPRVVSCGLASNDEGRRLTESEEVMLIRYSH